MVQLCPEVGVGGQCAGQLAEPLRVADPADPPRLADRKHPGHHRRHVIPDHLIHRERPKQIVLDPQRDMLFLIFLGPSPPVINHPDLKAPPGQHDGQLLLPIRFEAPGGRTVQQPMCEDDRPPFRLVQAGGLEEVAVLGGDCVGLELGAGVLGQFGGGGQVACGQAQG